MFWVSQFGVLQQKEIEFSQHTGTTRRSNDAPQGGGANGWGEKVTRANSFQQGGGVAGFVVINQANFPDAAGATTEIMVAPKAPQ